jgi:transcriptional regulator of arginine metabolism
MKNELEAAIIEVLTRKKVKNQTALAKLLVEKGIETDQSTLSRYLGKMGIEKKDGIYHLLEKKNDKFVVTPVPPNFIVLKTLPGHAQALAFKLDNAPLKGLVGTIAGDDTILCIIESSKLMKSVCNQLYSIEYL